MKKDLNDKIVIITGASSGIGLETALEFAKKGAKMALAARRADKVEAAAEILQIYVDTLSPNPHVSSGNVDYINQFRNSRI